MGPKQAAPDVVFRRLDRVLPVTFQDESTGDGSLTWGQRDMWDAREVVGGNDAIYNFALPVGLPPATTTEDICHVVRWLVGRHEVLRTLFRRQPSGPRQVICPQGTVQVDFYQSDKYNKEVGIHFVEERIQPLFNIEDEFPVRFHVLEVDNRAQFMCLAFSHVAMDGYAARLISAEIYAVLAGRPPVDAPTWTPLDQARYEGGPEGARRDALSLSYWRSMLQRIPPRLFDSVGARPGAESSAILEMKSSAVSRAAAVVARKAGVSTTAAVLAATVSALASATGKDVIPLQLLVGNRFDKKTASLVTNAVLNGICAVSTSGLSFEALAKACHWAAARAYSRAFYDPRHLTETIASVSEQRGCAFDLGIFFNDGRPQEQWLAAFTDGAVWPSFKEIEGLRGDTTIEILGSCDVSDLRLDIEIAFLSELDCHLRVRADLTCMSADDVQAMLLAVEETLVSAVQGLE